ncbi:MAG: hypothetical protein WC829_03280 [Hyphomicrobium sp.]|jgi:hypothetical protein
MLDEARRGLLVFVLVWADLPIAQAGPRQLLLMRSELPILPSLLVVLSAQAPCNRRI